MNFEQFSQKFKKINPKKITDDEESNLDTFFLTLGIFYNDLKSINIFFDDLKKSISENEKKSFSTRAGEYGGMITYLERLVMSTIYEFLDFLKENKTTLNKSEFKIIVKKINPILQERWFELEKIALTSKKYPEMSDLEKILFDVRNRLTFHYDWRGKNLREGFKTFFYKNERQEKNKWACYSIGKNMLETRFFYCDASAQGCIQNLVEDKMSITEYNEKISKLSNDLNFVIMELIKEYLNQKTH
jgi:hypothetical protein